MKDIFCRVGMIDCWAITAPITHRQRVHTMVMLYLRTPNDIGVLLAHCNISPLPDMIVPLSSTKFANT